MGTRHAFTRSFLKHLSSVSEQTELCHEVRNPGPPKPQIIRNENHHLALFETSGINHRRNFRDSSRGPGAAQTFVDHEALNSAVNSSKESAPPLFQQQSFRNSKSVSKQSIANVDGRNCAIVIAEPLARVIAAVRITSVRWRSCLPPKVSHRRKIHRKKIHQSKTVHLNKLF